MSEESYHTKLSYQAFYTRNNQNHSYWIKLLLYRSFSEMMENKIEFYKVLEDWVRKSELFTCFCFVYTCTFSFHASIPGNTDEWNFQKWLWIYPASLIAPMAFSLIRPVVSSLINTISGKEVMRARKGKEGEILPLLALTWMIRVLEKRYHNSRESK